MVLTICITITFDDVFCVGKFKLNIYTYRFFNMHLKFKNVITLLLRTSSLDNTENAKAEVLIYFYLNLY